MILSFLVPFSGFPRVRTAQSQIHGSMHRVNQNGLVKEFDRLPIRQRGRAQER